VYNFALPILARYKDGKEKEKKKKKKKKKKGKNRQTDV
jgi:hypothetical protein